MASLRSWEEKGELDSSMLRPMLEPSSYTHFWNWMLESWTGCPTERDDITATDVALHLTRKQWSSRVPSRVCGKMCWVITGKPCKSFAKTLTFEDIDIYIKWLQGINSTFIIYISKPQSSKLISLHPHF